MFVFPLYATSGKDNTGNPPREAKERDKSARAHCFKIVPRRFFDLPTSQRKYDHVLLWRTSVRHFEMSCNAHVS